MHSILSVKATIVAPRSQSLTTVKPVKLRGLKKKFTHQLRVKAVPRVKTGGKMAGEKVLKARSPQGEIG